MTDGTANGALMCGFAQGECVHPASLILVTLAVAVVGDYPQGLSVELGFLTLTVIAPEHEYIAGIDGTTFHPLDLVEAGKDVDCVFSSAGEVSAGDSNLLFGCGLAARKTPNRNIRPGKTAVRELELLATIDRRRAPERLKEGRIIDSDQDLVIGEANLGLLRRATRVLLHRTLRNDKDDRFSSLLLLRGRESPVATAIASEVLDKDVSVGFISPGSALVAQILGAEAIEQPRHIPPPRPQRELAGAGAQGFAMVSIAASLSYDRNVESDRRERIDRLHRMNSEKVVSFKNCCWHSFFIQLTESIADRGK